MATVLVTGANRGLGLEFVRQYAAKNWRVIATCRDPNVARELQIVADSAPELVNVARLDVLDHHSIDVCAQGVKSEPIDLLINNAGIIGPVREDIVGQSFSTMDYDVWDKVFRTNTMGPFKVAEAFFNNLKLGNQKKMAVISSTVGSNVEMKHPIFCYASSKAALTKTFTTLSEVLALEGISIRVFCPGHVKTDMGGSAADVEKETSIAGMIKQISLMNVYNTGDFVRYNGEVVAF